MEKLSLSKIVCILFVFCAVMAIASPTQTFTTLVSFKGTNGESPQSSLTQGTDGNFYGTTAFGGGNDNCEAVTCGTVFKITPEGTLTTMHSFDAADGGFPFGGLVQAADGNFYGTTEINGANGGGTVFKITPQAPYTLTTLYSFCSQYDCFDGSGPVAGLVQGADGNFYGTTYSGGNSNNNCPSFQVQGCGTVFKITSTGALTPLYSFCSLPNCPDGNEPFAGLVQGSDGNFYGTTEGGGANGGGTVFKITTTGTLTTLHSFCSQPSCADGEGPKAGLVQGTDGNFYGTTQSGGTFGEGTVFRINPQSPYALTTLHSFCSLQNCLDGTGLVAGLVQAKDGNFYGTTQSGGTFGEGTVFGINPQSPYTLTTLHSFCSGFECSYQPVAGLVQGTDSNFYGTTQNGGAFGYPYGTVFSLSLAGPNPVQLVPMTPCRLVDTRKQYGGNGPIQGGTFETFNLPQLAQEKDCSSLSSAAAYSLNVAVVPSGRLGYLTIWPTGESQPAVSTLNSPDGRIKANAAIVQAGTNGAVNVFVSDTTNVILDIDGYFAPPSSSTRSFYNLPPCRVADTRNNNFPQGLGPPSLQAGMSRDFPVLNSTCNIPNDAVAYSLNLTAAPPGSLGYLTAWPKGQPRPVVSTLNDPTGTAVANVALVQAGTNGDIEVYASDNTDLVIDINGYYAAPGGQNGLSLYPVAPCRVFDTRYVGNGKPFINELTVQVANSECGPLLTAQAYVFNATVVPSGSLGYLTLWPDGGGSKPLVSTLNALDGAITSNMAIVPNIDGSTDAYASDLTQLILDITSYFAP